MATDLSELIDSLRYLVAAPGTFDTKYAHCTEDMLVQILADGFAEAQFSRVFPWSWDVDEDGIVDHDMGSGQKAIVVLFAGIRLLRTAMMNAKSVVEYKAGSAVYHVEQSATLLRDILSDLTKQRDALIDQLDDGTGPDAGNVAFYMADQYLARVVHDWSCDSYDSVVVGW